MSQNGYGTKKCRGQTDSNKVGIFKKKRHNWLVAANRSFGAAKIAARGARKVITGITGLWQPIDSSGLRRLQPEAAEKFPQG